MTVGEAQTVEILKVTADQGSMFYFFVWSQSDHIETGGSM